VGPSSICSPSADCRSWATPSASTVGGRCGWSTPKSGTVTINNIGAPCPICAEARGEDLTRWAREVRLRAYQKRQRDFVDKWDKRVKEVCG